MPAVDKLAWVRRRGQTLQTYVHDASFVTSEDQNSFNPLIRCAFIEGATCDFIVLSITHFLLNKQVSVQSEHSHIGTAAKQYMSSQIVDLCTLNSVATVVCMLENAHTIESVQVPEKHLAVYRSRDQSAEGTRSREDTDRCPMTEEIGA